MIILLVMFWLSPLNIISKTFATDTDVLTSGASNIHDWDFVPQMGFVDDDDKWIMWRGFDETEIVHERSVPITKIKTVTMLKND